MLTVYGNDSRKKYEETDERICKDRIDSMLVTGPMMRGEETISSQILRTEKMIGSVTNVAELREVSF